MLSQEELKKLKEILESSQNPVFFFDNDADGLCSYILLKKSLQRGKGVMIKSFPDLGEHILHKVEELNADQVFCLDYSLISQGFIEGLKERNIPLTIIDHHKVENYDFVKEYAEIFNSYPSSEPTAYLCYKVFPKKENQWLAMVGCVNDIFKPEFAKEFAKENSEIYQNKLDTFETLYKTEIGKIALMLNYGLKDSTTNVLKIMKLLEKSSSPQDILQETSETKDLHKKYNKLNEYINKVLKKSEKINEKLVILEYSGQNSLSSEVSNRLFLENRDKLILVAFKKTDFCNISMRGKNAKKTFLEAIKNIDGASGGGHEEACGGRVPTDNWQDFKNKIIEA